ncbi:MAG: DUF58 domain-containing protein [Cuniculiplasma divulgatum]|nr:MAG: DUF58 domain-containing protein [Cuniculiplasma divulgatum]
MIKKSGYALISAVTSAVLEALFFGYRYFIIFSLVLFFVIAADIILFNKGTATDLFRIRIERFLKDDHGRKHQPKEIRVRFTNPTSRTITFHYYDTLSDVFRTEGDFEGEIALSPGQTVEKAYSIESIAIGKYKIGPLITYVQDPMKICITRSILEKIDEVKIGPALSDIYTQRSERLSNFLFTAGMHYSRKSGQGYDFYGVRQYVESDDFRYIVWDRYNGGDYEDLFIKQMEEERQIDVYFVMDYSSGMNQGTATRRMYDTVVTSVLNASYSIIKNRDGVGFQVISSSLDHFIPAQKSEEPIKKLEKLVAEIRPSGDFSIEAAVEKIRKRIKKNAVVFIISAMSFPENFHPHSPRDYQTGRPTYLFLVDGYDFVDKREDEVFRKLMISTANKQRRYIKAVSHFFNGIGIKTATARERDLLLRLMAEYGYARTLNLGG